MDCNNVCNKCHARLLGEGIKLRLWLHPSYRKSMFEWDLIDKVAFKKGVK